MKIEIFSQYKPNVHELQARVNLWMVQNVRYMKVKEVLQTETNDTLTITVVFEVLDLKSESDGYIRTHYVDQKGNEHVTRLFPGTEV